MRWLLAIHRYLGIAIGLLMSIWCISGVVMMYVHYPELSSADRQRHLQLLDLTGCCVISDTSLANATPIESFQLETVGARPMLRIEPVGGSLRLIDLLDGHTLRELSTDTAASVATSFARATGYSGQPQLRGRIDYDQWTVSGEFKPARPLFLFALADPDGTQFYVSAVTGQVVQVTTAKQRFWNWLGAVPHWLYFTQLRRNAPVWAQVVIWTSLAGCFLTLLGIYIGVMQFLRSPNERGSPYRGILWWHHVPGLMFGIFLLAWVASGLVSMNPWGFLDSDGSTRAESLLRGGQTSGAAVKAAIRSLPALARRPRDIVSVESARLFGQLYLAVTTQAGARLRFDPTGSPAPLDDAAWTRIAQQLSSRLHATPAFLPHGDAYYFSRNGHDVRAAYRIVGDDEQQTRYYFDPLTAELIATFDSNARWYRWLHQGLHTLDFTATLRARPKWDIVMLILLAGTTMSALTGTYIGLRRLTRPLRVR
jgi:uncharacterized iron-regulated membrane protein